MSNFAADGREWEYAPTRLLHFRALLGVPRFALSAYFESALQALPFKLGESAAETSIPYAVDDELALAADAAVDDLVELVRRRRDGELEPRPPPPGSFAGQDERKLIGLSQSSQPFAERSVASAAALRALRLAPSLDASVMEAWLLRGHGATLLAHLAGVFAKACDEDVRAGGTTPYLQLAFAAVVDLGEARKQRARGLVTRLYPWERAEKAVGFSLFALAEAAAEAALEPLARKRMPFDSALYALRNRAAFSPLAFCSIRAKALQNDLNPWEISQAMADSLDRVWLALLEDDPSPRTAEARLVSAVADDRELATRTARAGAIAAFRRHARRWLAVYEGLDPELTSALLGMIFSDEAIFRQLHDAKALAARLQKFSKGRKADPAGEAATAGLLDSLKRGPEREDTVREVASAYACLALDRVAVGALDSGRLRLRDRRAEYTRDQLVADYTAGRLYRLSSDSKEIRRSLTRKQQGHLFIDLKGFTQRTYRAKEIVMAEFLRTEFYEPILSAAAQLCESELGGRQLALQNLLGDAAVFSGELPALVELAQSIQRICKAYGEKLRARTGQDEKSVDARRQELEATLRGELEGLRAEAAVLEQEIARKLAMPPLHREQLLFTGLANRLLEVEARSRDAAVRGDLEGARQAQAIAVALRNQERELAGQAENLFGPARDEYLAGCLVAGDRKKLAELERRAAEARRAFQEQLKDLEEDARSSRGYGLEAGLFITYGAAAEVASMNDKAFGQVKVAIAEKINEAARGTARNGTIKAKLDALLDVTRATRGRPDLEFPFRVYVDSAYNLLLTADLNDLVDRSVRERSPDRARDTARRIAEAVLRDLARAMGLGDGQQPESLTILSDIYNTGEALSGEALSAYLAATATTHFWFRRTLSTSELSKEFLDRFVFVGEELDLVVSVTHDGEIDKSVIFRRAGQVQFRGFEAKHPTTVWELLRPESPFHKLLVAKHIGLWAAEAKTQTGPVPLPK